MDGCEIHFAPENHWNDEIPLVKYQQTVVSTMVLKWCKLDFVHPQYDGKQAFHDSVALSLGFVVGALPIYPQDPGVVNPNQLGVYLMNKTNRRGESNVLCSVLA